MKDRKSFTKMVDPLLQGRYPAKSVQHAIVITSMCLQEHASIRPLMTDVVSALEYLASQAEKSPSTLPSPCLAS